MLAISLAMRFPSLPYFDIQFPCVVVSVLTNVAVPRRTLLFGVALASFELGLSVPFVARTV